MAVFANVVFFAAYPVDIFAQLSAFISKWLRLRWLLFLIGLVKASVFARFISIDMFHSS